MDRLLYATVIRMVAKHDGRIRATHGEQAHGAFLDIIRASAPEIAEDLHGGDNRYKPFTVSPLAGLSHPKHGYAAVKAGDIVEMRITLLDAKLFAPLMAHFVRGGKRPTLRIGQVVFEVTEVLSTPGAHPRAGYVRLNELYTRWCNYPGALPRELTLHFLTPTTIRVGKWPDGQKRFLVLPFPERIWYSLRRFWGAFGGEDPGKEYNNWVERHVDVIAFEIKTRMLEFNRHPQVGFVGWVSFRATSDDRDAMVLWHALADFAFYAGVGDQKTKGMGQVVRDDR